MKPPTCGMSAALLLHRFLAGQGRKKVFKEFSRNAVSKNYPAQFNSLFVMLVGVAIAKVKE